MRATEQPDVCANKSVYYTVYIGTKYLLELLL
jgi:hypothetical protein